MSVLKALRDQPEIPDLLGTQDRPETPAPRGFRGRRRIRVRPGTQVLQGTQVPRAQCLTQL